MAKKNCKVKGITPEKLLNLSYDIKKDKFSSVSYSADINLQKKLKLLSNRDLEYKLKFEKNDSKTVEFIKQILKNRERNVC